MPTRGNGPGGPTRPRPPALLLGVAGVLGLALLATAVRPPWHMVARDFGVKKNPPGAPPAEGMPPPGANPTAIPRSDITPSVPPPWIKWALLAAVIVVVAFLLVRWLRRRLEKVEARPTPVDLVVEVVPELPVLQRGAEEAERHLIAGGDPTDAIVAAWMALEEAAAASGVTRRPAQTPTEFTAAVLNRTGVDPGSVQTLLRLYLRARFSASGAGPDDLEAARHCVRRLAADWRSFSGYDLTDAPGTER